MKKAFILLIGILFISCNQYKNVTKSSKTAENFDWLLGKWKRSNEVVGKETFENWDKKSDTEYTGYSYTTQNGVVIYEEKFWFIKSNNSWDFKIELKGETKPSSFKMTSHNKQEFICENNALNYTNRKADSPNKIQYWTNEDKLYATISGKKIKLQFEYIRLKK